MEPKDFCLEWHGSLFLLRPMTDRGRAWLADTAPDDAQFMGDAMAIEPRYVEGVVCAAFDAGLIVQH